MPSKEKETVVETSAEEISACACGTHAKKKLMIVHAIVGVIALFMLCTAFAAGAFVGKVAGNHSGRDGRGYEQTGFGNRGSGMMSGGGRGMMQNGQGYGYYHNQQDATEGTTEDSTAPATPETTVPATPQGGAAQ